jgi:peptidoglycan lytic transglycosylase G
MKLLRFLMLVVTIAIVTAALVAGSVFYPYASFQNETFVEIPKGTGTRGIANLLASAGVVRYPWLFLAARALRPKPPLQAGEYRFTQKASASQVLDRIARGDVFYYELTVPEGQSIFDIAASLDELGVIGAKDFLATAKNPAMIRDLAPRAPTLEGYLFPSTYRITRRTTAEQLCRQMTDQFRKVWKNLASTAPVHETVTLASLIEKEAAVKDERPLIASVFQNRLGINMPLQCDPTTIYASMLQEKYRGTLFRSDLADGHPYNTYQHAGLPPGPIANPGAASLKAALNPAESDYLYFVAKADKSGAHQFSTGLGEHQRAVAQYRRGQKAEHAGSTPRAH